MTTYGQAAMLHVSERTLQRGGAMLAYNKALLKT